MTYLLDLDQGTSSSHRIVFDTQRHVVALALQELPQIYPQPGCVEHDPHAIWQTQLATAREALAKADLQARDIHAVGITNQREITLTMVCRPPLPRHRLCVFGHAANDGRGPHRVVDATSATP